MGKPISKIRYTELAVMATLIHKRIYTYNAYEYIISISTDLYKTRFL